MLAQIVHTTERVAAPSNESRVMLFDCRATAVQAAPLVHRADALSQRPSAAPSYQRLYDALDRCKRFIAGLPTDDAAGYMSPAFIGKLHADLQAALALLATATDAHEKIAAQETAAADAARDTVNHRHASIASAVAATLPLALTVERDAVVAQAQTAQDALRLSQRMYASLASEPPVSEAQVKEWSVRLATARAEVEAFSIKAIAALTIADTAEQAYRAALTTAWQSAKQSAAIAVDALVAQGAAATQVAQEELVALRQRTSAANWAADLRLVELVTAGTIALGTAKW